MTAFAPANLKAYVCSHVFATSRPVLLVANEDGDWMFLCGCDDHASTDCLVVGVGHLIARDPSLNECADLAAGFEAERQSVEHPWVRAPLGD